MTHHNKGFTLVELTLAMAFLSILLLAIAMLVLQIGNIYNKGITMRAVNQAGQTITSDIQRTLNSSSPQEIQFAPEDQALQPSGARFCVGNTVYAWNYGKYLDTADVFNKYESGSRQVRLVKFSSKGEKYCELVSGAYLSIPVDDDVSELISPDDSNLAIHRLEITASSAANDVSQQIYMIYLKIGTNDTDNIDEVGCTQPKTIVDDSYCAVNEFAFTARAGNKGE